MSDAPVNVQPDPAQFVALPKRAVVVPVSKRPVVSYWSGIWKRLRANRQAIVSFYVLIALFAFTLFGPLLWPVSYELQNLSFISRPPALSQEVRLVDANAFWQPPRAAQAEMLPAAPKPPGTATGDQSLEQMLPAPRGLRVEGVPNTHSVRLLWAPVPGAVRYHLYRNDYRPQRINELGLPLGAAEDGVLGFEDQLQLRGGTYYYAITADSGMQESSHFETLAVSVRQAISIEAALDHGLLAGQLGDHAPAEMNADSASQSVRLSAHPLGTDYLGRDILARLIQGARTSLFIGIVAPVIFVLLGAFYGALAGLRGGLLDSVMMRFADFVVALPFLLFVILFRIASGTQSGESGIGAILVAFIVLLWPATARLVRGQVLQLKTAAYVQAARLMGASTPYLLLRQLLPGTAGVILVTLTFAIPSAIFTETFLSFIGMGVAPPTPSWGSMCFEGLRTMTVYPHTLLFPALLISLTVLAFNLFGDGLRDALDTRLQSSDGGAANQGANKDA